VQMVTSDGLRELQELKSLTQLKLYHFAIGAAEVEELKKLKSLKLLELASTNITDERVEAIKKALPDCHVKLGSIRSN